MRSVSSRPSATATGSSIPFQGTIATSDGESVWAFRYSSEGNSRTLFYSTAIETLRGLYPDNEIFQSVGEESRLVVSEPLGTLPGVWNAVPESSYGVIKPGPDELHPFAPIPPAEFGEVLPRWRPRAEPH